MLENPDRISKTVLARRLDAQTAFEIVSIDIADVDVGENIGARLQADQAEADMRVARANAEGRRAMAVAEEQEMIAQIEQNRAKVLEAEAEVPKAIAHAFHSGKLGADGLLQAPQHPGRHRHAFVDRQGRHDRDRQKNEQHGMSPFAPLLAANDAELVKLVIIVVFGILVGIAKFMAMLNKAKPPAAMGQRPVPPPIANVNAPNEIEEFMRRAAAKPRPAANAAPIRRSPQPQLRPPVEKPVQAQVIPDEPVARELGRRSNAISTRRSSASARRSLAAR